MREHVVQGTRIFVTTRRGVHKYCGSSVILIAVLSMLCCAVLTFVVGAYNRTANPVSSFDYPKEALSAGPASPPSRSTDERLEAQVIVLTRFGFEPNQIVRPQDEFLLAVENRSEVGDVDLHLDKVAGNRIHHQYVPRTKPDWQDFFRLEPGDYVLTESNHPDWICTIRITPH